MQNASILLICLCVFTAIKISVKTEQQKSLFLYMQKKYSHKRMSSTSLPCPLLWPSTACLAWTRQWVLDGDLFTV